MTPASASSVATRSVVHVTVFAALTAVLGLLPPIPVPIIPVPITAQTLGVMLSGAILGPRKGALAVGLFLLCVALGFPLLAGGRGGLGVFFAPGGGFLFGWPLGAAVIGMLLPNTTLPTMSKMIGACLLGGICAVYAVGVPWMATVGDLGIGQAAVASLAFLPGDIVKAVIAATVTRAVVRGYPLDRR